VTPLDRLRGPFPTKRFDARRIAATLEQPGCDRRLTLDAAHVHLNRLAEVLGAPPARQSPFALTRGNAFERQVMDSGMAGLLPVLRSELGMSIGAVRQVDLSAEQVASTYGKATPSLRLLLTRQRLTEMLIGDPAAANLIRHPLLAVSVAGLVQYVEADVMALVHAGRLHIVEIKSYQAIDGRPDPAKVAQTALQSAVYVLAIQDLVEDLGFPVTIVSTDVLLVVPANFSFTPVGYRTSVRSRVSRLRRQLASLPAASTIAEALPDDLVLPAAPGRTATVAERDVARRQAAEVVSAISPLFGDGCPTCPLFRFCRDEARSSGAVDALGSAITADIGDVATVDAALALARGEQTPTSPPEAAVAETLSRAMRAATSGPRR
jgi:hypothetical protein